MCRKLIFGSRVVAGFALTAATVLSISSARAASGFCETGRYNAAAKYVHCELKANARSYSGGDGTRFQAAASKCRIKYDHTCEFDHVTDNGNGTVTDYLTGLQWEQKTDDATVHDKDNVYTWSAGLKAADGPAFTSFLATLNSGDCFAGQCDWRLPTRTELQTILLPEPFPCTTSPCIDQGLFGPTAADYYWSSTTNAPIVGPFSAWTVSFINGRVDTHDKNTFNLPVRAVRGGL